VRDAYIDKESKDVDLIIDGFSFSGIQKALAPYGKQNLVGDSFSVIKFRPKGWEGEDYDIAIPREDRKIGAGHKGFEIVTDGVDIHGDLKRRDFTINSMAVNVITGEILDPFNGEQDLKNRVIKATDSKAFAEDPLRILRGIQFSARFDFDIEKGTMKMMKDNAHLIKEITGERILTEFEKIINKGSTQRGLDLLHETDVDKALFDKKMLRYDKEFDHLDTVSFYYMLALIGDQDPFTFYMKRLKGNTDVGNGIKILDSLIKNWYNSDEVERKYLVMNAITKLPRLDDIALLPPDTDSIILKMRSKDIPMTKGDVPIDGESIMRMYDIPPGKRVGLILDQMYKDALMNKYDWKDKSATQEYAYKLDM
jgi:tRNA nucleotidyltransferase/poly(A) polymerase